MIKIDRIKARTSYRKGIPVYVGKDKVLMLPYPCHEYGSIITKFKGNVAFAFESRRLRVNLNLNKLEYYTEQTQ